MWAERYARKNASGVFLNAIIHAIKLFQLTESASHDQKFINVLGLCSWKLLHKIEHFC